MRIAMTCLLVFGLAGNLFAKKYHAESYAEKEQNEPWQLQLKDVALFVPMLESISEELANIAADEKEEARDHKILLALLVCQNTQDLSPEEQAHCKSIRQELGSVLKRALKHDRRTLIGVLSAEFSHRLEKLKDVIEKDNETKEALFSDPS